MELTKEQIDAMQEYLASEEYEIFMMKRAAESGNTWSDYHPSHYQAKITRLRKILSRAGFPFK